MNYGLQHRYYARNFGAAPSTVSLLTSSGKINTGIPPGVDPSTLAVPGMAPPRITPSGWSELMQVTGGYSGSSVAKPGAISSDAAPAICLDVHENSISCSDPNCTFGDCGAPAGVQQVTTGSLCLDQTQNQIACNDANCTYGDCTASWWSHFDPTWLLYGLAAVVALDFITSSARRR